jgi:MFS transporter, DHA1 family, multidrug resistance protein
LENNTVNTEAGIDRFGVDVPGESHAIRFRIFAAMAMAASALSIDSILPTFGAIRTELGLPAGSSATAGLITAFFLGMALGQIPIGVFSDRYGRRPVLFFSAAVFLVGILGMGVSTSLNAMLAARFVWGLGAAGLRIAALAMVRDRFVGARMAREMSFVMAVFLIVPMFAPALGAGILHFFSWRVVLVLSAVFGLILGVLTFLMPETLKTENRQPLRFSQISTAAKAIVRHPASWRYMLLLTAIFGVFSSYLASSERIVGEVYGRKAMFPFLFGGVGLAMGILSVIVGRNVERIGLVKVIRTSVVGYLISTVVVLGVVLLSNGAPYFWLYWLTLTAVLAIHNIVFPNVNSAAMIPLGHVAGTASALVGTLSGAAGALMGAGVDRAFDGTVRPLTSAFVLSGIVALGLAYPIRKL